MFELFKFLINPEPDSIAETPEQFLGNLNAPTIIHQSGFDSNRTRVITTLLHGNEPSGIKAVHRWLKSKRKPATDVVFIIPSVQVALHEELYKHRVLPGKRDLNRCFKAPYQIDEQGKLAHKILEVLTHYQPEAVIDMHNTSGAGPAFAVSVSEDKNNLALCSLFTNHLIITTLKLGALMEISEFLYPTITLECGGRLQNRAHQVAWNGIKKFLTVDNVFDTSQIENVDIAYNPFRVELQPESSITYAEQIQADATLTLPPTVEQLNLGITKADTFLGWTNSDKLSDVFVVDTDHKTQMINSIFNIENNQLLSKTDLKLFMVTTNPKIAKTDCLCYCVKVEK